MLSETRPSKVGKWTEPALRVLRERYLARKGDEGVETPEEMCWGVAQAIAAGEARYGRSPRPSTRSRRPSTHRVRPMIAAERGGGDGA